MKNSHSPEKFQGEIKVPVAAIKLRWNPFEWDIWGCGVVTPEEVGFAVANKITITHRPNDFRVKYWTMKDRAHRIAYFVLNGWQDAIHIDVGVPELGFNHFSVDDGNHRLAAAIYLKQEFITAEVSGSVGYMQELFA